MTQPLALAGFPDCHQCDDFRCVAAGTCFACAARTLIKPAADACEVCAQHTGPEGNCPNELCRDPARQIEKIHAIGYQSGPLRRAINGYKYGGVRSWSVVFGRFLLAWLEQHMAADPPGLIVANPSWTGPGGQGLAHTELVLAAAAGADATDRWPFDVGTPAAVIKTRRTLKSADAQAWSKRVAGRELREALAVPDPGRTSGKFILVYDDICTTGTQLDAVAAVLLERGGASRVQGVVLARAQWRGR